MDPLLPIWLIVTAAIGACAGILLERTRGAAAKRAARFEAELVQARSELMRYQEQTKLHFGKSAELLGRMATDYREFLHHFVTGAEELCGSHLKELDASGLERPLLDGTAGSTVAAAPPPPAAETETAAPMPPPETLAAMSAPLDREPLAEDVAK